MTWFKTKNGFSLIEVCVAVAVLVIGISALLVNFDLFNFQLRRERLLSRQMLAAYESMEKFIREAPACSDSSYAVNYDGLNVFVDVTIVSKAHRLSWLEVRCSETTFRRLVRCK